jgi:protein SCO1/2
MRRAVVCLASSALLAAAGALAQTPAAPQARLEERPGAMLPLDLALRDAQGRDVRLGDFFGSRPVVLVLGYYGCPQLCGLLMHGLLEGLREAALGPADVTIVGVSIDPDDTPASAAARERADRAYARFLSASAEPDLHLLVGAPAGTARLADRAGFVFERGDDTQRYAHAAGVVVVTPQGRIARDLLGVRFDAAELRLALADAAAERTGEPASGFALLCAHVDPRLGRHSAAVLGGIRALAGFFAAGGLALAWRHRRRRTAGARS